MEIIYKFAQRETLLCVFRFYRELIASAIVPTHTEICIHINTYKLQLVKKKRREKSRHCYRGEFII